MTVKILSVALCGILFLTTGALADQVTLSAAASLREVVTGLTDAYRTKHPEVRTLLNFGASGTLAKQIEQGAPADIFISANREWMDYLQNRKLVDEASRCAFAYNSLVFAGITKQPVMGMKELVRLRRIAIGSPRSVPAGEYAAEAFRAAGIEKELAGKLVMAKDVREAMKYAELGEVDGAFVYRTDALLFGKKARILFTVPAGLHDRVVYPMALTATGAGKPGARELFRFLQSAEARKILGKYGFEVK
ncbi:molybdate ABC transporter substrate-binding protein [Geobacter sp.]|uniref:molybdate ABC transporter substrate-binding protein n=1 Tax=Geobacter sp. TaxID=46610 RepID=UPI00260EEAE1|nr:molybdate ABC transporter substrate-binding protein [Geobacter sp.]